MRKGISNNERRKRKNSKGKTRTKYGEGKDKKRKTHCNEHDGKCAGNVFFNQSKSPSLREKVYTGVKSERQHFVTVLQLKTKMYVKKTSLKQI